MVFRRRYKHFHRLREIANTFAKHGLGYLFDRLGIRDVIPVSKRFEAKEKVSRLSRGERVRLVFEELGTTFVKLGQVLSTRADLLPKDVVKELEKLQDHAAPVDYNEIKQLIEEELGENVEELFYSFERHPSASASIAQVHKAVLTTGEKVVVKVRRPELRQKIETDLEILFDVARLADRRTALGARYSFTDLVEEFSRSLYAEVDFRIEGRNADRLRENFKKNPQVCIPEVYWEYSTSTVITLQRLEGIKLSDFDELDRKGYDRKKIANDLAEIMLKQVLLDGFFHADPHPGNIFVLDKGRLGFMDFGIVGSLNRERKNQLTSLLISFVGYRSEALLQNILEMGITPPNINKKELKADIEKLREKYYSRPVEEIEFGEAFNELLDLSYKHGIRMPMDFVLLSKSLIITEGIVRELDPELSLMEVVEPFARTLIKKQFSPANVTRVVQDLIIQYGNSIVELPKLLRGLREKAEDPEIRGVIRHEGFERVLTKMDQITNRLSFSIVLLAFSILMSGLTIASAVGASTGGLFIRFPVFEVGFIAGGLMFFWLILSIIRSGKF